MPQKLFAAYAEHLDRFLAADTLRMASAASIAQVTDRGTRSSYFGRLQSIAEPPPSGERTAPTAGSEAAWKARLSVIGIGVRFEPPKE